MCHLCLNGLCDITGDSPTGLSTEYSLVGMGRYEPSFGVDCQGDGLLWYLLWELIPCWCGATSPLSSIFAPWCQYSCLGGWSSHGLQRPSYWVLLTGRTGGLTCSGPDNKDSLNGGGTGGGNLALYLRGRSSSSLWPRNEVTPVTAACTVEYMELPAWVTLVATVLTAVERASRKLISWSCLSMDVYIMMGVWSFKSSRPISSTQESLLLEAILENLQSPNA